MFDIEKVEHITEDTIKNEHLDKAQKIEEELIMLSLALTEAYEMLLGVTSG